MSSSRWPANRSWRKIRYTNNAAFSLIVGEIACFRKLTLDSPSSVQNDCQAPISLTTSRLAVTDRQVVQTRVGWQLSSGSY
jgi:hypothetical protein